MIDGSILVGGEDRRGASDFHAYNPATGESFGPAVAEASLQDVADACALAAGAAETFAALEPAARANFIDAAAQAILDIGDLLIETAMAETGLPRPRLGAGGAFCSGAGCRYGVRSTRGRFLAGVPAHSRTCRRRACASWTSPP